MLPHISSYQASINGNREITANTEMDSLAKLAAGPTAQSLNKGGSSGRTTALCNRKISKDQMVRARNCNSLNRRQLHPCRPFWCRSLTKPNLKHVSIKLLSAIPKLFKPLLQIGYRVITKYVSTSFNKSIIIKKNEGLKLIKKIKKIKINCEKIINN